MSPSTRSRVRRPVPDSACLDAVDLARNAAEEVAPGEVGDHLGAETEADRLATHLFACLTPAYRGWRWAVTVTRAARARAVTVAEVVLLPGPESLLAPPWVPWSERILPGDLGVGDLLPTLDDDERLAPGYTGADEGPPDPDDELGLLGWELGRGRVRVLSAEGRDQAAERWHSGEGGPDAPIAAAAPAHCSTCGFLLPLSGPLGQVFGTCANAMSPSDGRVVAFGHGCGAHSEAVVVHTERARRPPTVVDHLGYDVALPAGGAGDDDPAAGEPGRP